MTKIYEYVDPAVIGVLSPDFAACLPGGVSLASVSLIEVTVERGVDPSPSSHFGAPQMLGTVGLIPFAGLIDGVTYHGRVAGNLSDGSVSVWSFTLPCRKA